jgi:mannosyltransferase OCH1-like enzyme
MNELNKVIHGMWIGNELSSIELLTIKSFIANGHQFYLWLYDNPAIEEMDNLIIKDASEIISREFVFSYKNKNTFGHGQGSYAGFSDIFRYKLLYEYGGWWVDMDVTCLKPFDFPSEYVFRPHHVLDVVGNVMKCPKGSDLMKASYEEAIETVNSDNTDWHKPIEILNKYIARFGLTGYIRGDLSYSDDWRVISKFIKGNNAYSTDYYFIHWLNEEWRARYLSKNIYRYHSTLGNLMKQHHVNNKKTSAPDYFLNYIQTSTFFEYLRLLNVVE